MAVNRLFLVLLFLELMVVFSSQNKMELHIGALVPYAYFQDYFSYKTAIDFAVETIHNKSLLQGYKMVIHTEDTRGKPEYAIQSLIKFNEPNTSNTVRICVLGPALSQVAPYTARLATVWGPLQVSYGVSTPALLDEAVYPRFLTVVPTSKSLNKAVIRLLKYFKWNRIALAYDVNEKNFFLPTMNALQVDLHLNGFNIAVEGGVSLKKKDGKSQLIQKLKEQDIRIVIALFPEHHTQEVMCEAYKQGYYGKRIVWITYLTSFVIRQDYCNQTQFEAVSNGMFVLNFQHFRADANKTISGLNVEEFKTQMKERHPEGKIGEKSSLAFDTTWLLALTLSASLEDAVAIQNVKYKTTRQRLNVITKLKTKMINTEFEGISGNVKFNDTERLGTVIIRQRREGRLVDVAQHYTLIDVFTFFPNQSTPTLLFKGTSYTKDGPSIVDQLKKYSSVLLIIIWIICALAISIAISLLYFNFKNREIRYIKMSSPHINNIIIFGGLLCYIKVFLDTLDSRFMNLETYGHFCNARVCIMSFGFTTSFGAMFSKTWRVHRIFTASKNFRRAVIKNFHLYGLLFTLLAVDIVLLTLWMILSPYKSGVLQLPVQVDEEKDEVLHPSIYNCTSKHENYFLITTLCYKGLLLVFGIFLAWETRNIEIKALNDSKYIGISVYNVVILSIVGVIIAALMAGTEHYNVYLALMSLVVIVCTAATLGIVFIPKVIGLQRVLTSTANETLETSYTTSNGSSETQPACCCCETCKCRCSTRKASIHVSNKFLASQSSSRRKSRHGSVPSISVTKPKMNARNDKRSSLTTCPISESNVGTPSPDESLRVGFLSAS